VSDATMNFNLVAEEETISIINKLKYKNSSGYDGITNKIIKLCRQQISKPLTYVINKSLTMGLYPERLKCAIINPVYKKGEKMESPDDACANAEFLLQILDEVTLSIFMSAEACPK
jgi:hypothetical protein